VAATPQNAQRHVPGAPDTTRPAQLATATPRSPTHAVTGPAKAQSGRPLTTPPGPPPLHVTPVMPPQTPQTVGVNPHPPANRSASVPSEQSPLATDIATGSVIGPYSGYGYTGY
jgi:hypothetical protein